MTTPEIEGLLLKLMSSTVLFRGLRRSELADLLRAATKVVFQRGDIVFDEGIPGDSLYVALRGKFEVFQKIEGCEAHLAVLAAGEHFGEIALITDRPRMASVRAMEESIALRLTKASIFGKPNAAIHLLKNIAGLMATHLSEMNNEILLLDASRRQLGEGGKAEPDDAAANKPAAARPRRVSILLPR